MAYGNPHNKESYSKMMKGKSPSYKKMMEDKTHSNVPKSHHLSSAKKSMNDFIFGSL